MKSALIALILMSLGSFTFAEGTKTEAPTEKTHEQNATAANPEGSEATKDNSSYVICRNQKQVRTIRVDLKGMACKAIYTKDGKDDIVGKSGTPQLCYEVVNKIRTNLEKHGTWTCKDVEPERVSFTTE